MTEVLQAFIQLGNVKDWTHKSVIKTTDTQDDETILNSRNLMGGVLGFDFKNINAVKLLENWYALCSVPENIFPEGSSINNHRHDQSLISICYWKSFKKNAPNTQQIIRNNNPKLAQQNTIFF